MLGSIVHQTRCFLGREKTRVLRKLNLIKTDWKSALPDEAEFWADALTNPKEKWNLQEFNDRTNPDLPLQDDLKLLLRNTTGDVIRILDVGAGPLTRLGKTWDGKVIEITATDPLADDYDIILKKAGIVPIVRTIKGEGENISSSFPEAFFDLAYASNCLDHARDPIEVIRQMLAVVKPGCSIYLWHFMNSGLAERYHGLHQWNFERSGRDMRISDGKKSFLLSERILPGCLVDCRDESAFGNKVVVTTIRKQ